MDAISNKPDLSGEILVVDDSLANLKLLQDLLITEGYEVRPSNDPELALKSAIAEPPDLTLLDVKMPIMDGFELCQHLKQHPHTKDVPVMFVSALNELDDQVRGFEVGGVDYITKPIQQEEILARIATHLAMSKKTRDLECAQNALMKQHEELVFKTDELTNSKQALEHFNNKLQHYLNIIDKYVVTSSTDIDGLITSTSTAFRNITGYSKEELLGKNHNILRHPDMPKLVYEDLWETISNGRPWKGELKNRSKDGNEYWVESNIEPIQDENGAITGYTSIRHDITAKKIAEKLSVTDQLTQIYNRLKLDNSLINEIERAERYGHPFSLILLDVDHFKSVNDTYGHQVGDEVLIHIADLLRSNVRTTDILGRWGGEEFLVLCPGTDSTGVLELAEKLRNSIETHDFQIVESKTCSFGIATYQSEDTEISLNRRVDTALYRAKEKGRNRIEIAPDF